VNKYPFACLALCILLSLVLSVDRMDAHPRYYDENETPGSNCSQCHSAFTDNFSPGGAIIPTSKHEMHRNSGNMNATCNLCHTNGDGRNPFMGSSQGASGIGYGCSGCHGRLADVGNAVAGSAELSGSGAGLRQHHFNAGQTLCETCHADANPANYTPVGEDVNPPYYGVTADSDAAEPCNPTATANLNENWSLMDFEGLDNDGDSVYDALDTDCMPVTASPGETAGDTLLQVLVTASTATTISTSYGPACGVTGNTIAFGPLSNVSTYGYSGETCGFDNSGSVTWDYAAAGAPTSLFFLIVGNDGALEGSYGTDSDGTERPRHTTNVSCLLPQNLAGRCD